MKCSHRVKWSLRVKCSHSMKWSLNLTLIPIRNNRLKEKENPTTNQVKCKDKENTTINQVKLQIRHQSIPKPISLNLSLISSTLAKDLSNKVHNNPAHNSILKAFVYPKKPLKIRINIPLRICRITRLKISKQHRVYQEITLVIGIRRHIEVVKQRR